MRLLSNLVRLCCLIAITVTLAPWQSASAQSKKTNVFTPQVVAVSPNVVISQVYGGAGCGTAGCSTYQNDYIELFNRNTAPVTLTGYSVQYAAATGTAWQVTAIPTVTLQPGQYFLVAESFGANGVNPLPTPDVTGTIAMSATAAKVALVNTTTALTGACPLGANVLDFIGYGATASCSETAVAPAPSTTTADIRGGGGGVDTDNNSTDFQAAAPTPRNTASAFGTPTVTTPTQAGQLIISEFRLSGPAGAQDEFIELYNTTSTSLTTQAADASAGLGVVASDGALRCTVPNGIVIPARGHYLCANNTTTTGYSISAYPAGSGATATPNATYTTDIPLNAGIALFNTVTPANFVLSNRLDAVGSTSEANALYREGAGYLPLNANTTEYSFYRKNDPATGLPTDTNANENDFLFVNTDATSATFGQSVQRLGAPGPENLSSPRIKNQPQIPGAQLDPTVMQSGSPNRVRDYTAGSSPQTFGTLSIRRTYTNNTGAAITRLRFRIVDITNFPAPAGTADLRAITSTTGMVSTSLGSINVEGLTLETPPAQPNGGGFNSTLSAGTITTGTPLANGAMISVNFLMGVQQAGAFRFFVVVEAAP